MSLQQYPRIQEKAHFSWRVIYNDSWFLVRSEPPRKVCGDEEVLDFIFKILATQFRNHMFEFVSISGIVERNLPQPLVSLGIFKS